MTDDVKFPINQTMNTAILARIADEIQLQGKALPCSVAAIQSSGIVTVNFEINSAPFTLPQVTVPLGHPEYIRYPIKVGDKGWVAPAAARLGGLTGLGSPGTPTLSQPANLAALVFYWLGNVAWPEVEDPNALVGYGPSGTISRDTNSMSVHTVAPAGIAMKSPSVMTTGNVAAGTGATGSFTTPAGQTVTVADGLITNIF